MGTKRTFKDEAHLGQKGAGEDSDTEFSKGSLAMLQPGKKSNKVRPVAEQATTGRARD